MNRLNFEFIADKSNNTLNIKREFDAEKPLVWDCFTKQHLLEKWWAPHPFTIETKSMYFASNGHWHYAMVDEAKNKYWGLTNYSNIQVSDSFETTDSFSNDKGEINVEMPISNWNLNFAQANDKTFVEITILYHSLTDLEKVVNMGMQQGLTATFEQLDRLLSITNK